MPTDKYNELKDFFMKELQEIKVALAELPEKIFDKADDRYASKGVEKIVWLLGGAVITAIVMVFKEYIFK